MRGKGNLPRSAAHHAEGRDYPSDLEQAVKKSAAAIPKRGTVLLCTGHHAHLSHAHPGVNVAATEGPLVIATPLADSSLAHPRCAGPCQSRCRGTLPLSRCRHPSQAFRTFRSRHGHLLRADRGRPGSGGARSLFGRAATDDGNSILDYVAAVADFAVARAAYRAACRRWPEAKITLRQGARVMERNWSTSEAAN